MKPLSADLIYDVGLLDGADTAYYLFRGYRVVAIDANSQMIEMAGARFAKEIGSKRLTLVNAGIGLAPGAATFWISDKPQWSSFDKSIASRDGTGHRPVSVPVVPFSDILAEYGIPHYLKIDIEGHDRMCLDALRGGRLPKYLSVESDDQAITMLELLRDIGYRRFKLVNQVGWLPVRPNGVGLFCSRLIASAAWGRLRIRPLSRIAEKFTDPARIASCGFAFSPGCTGPWGEDVPGGWMTLGQAKSTYLREWDAFLSRQQQPHYSFWYDWHATY
jgi:FkbM family methyltransferase